MSNRIQPQPQLRTDAQRANYPPTGEIVCFSNKDTRMRFGVRVSIPRDVRSLKHLLDTLTVALSAAMVNARRNSELSSRIRKSNDIEEGDDAASSNSDGGALRFDIPIKYLYSMDGQPIFSASDALRTGRLIVSSQPGFVLRIEDLSPVHTAGVKPSVSPIRDEEDAAAGGATAFAAPQPLPHTFPPGGVSGKTTVRSPMQTHTKPTETHLPPPPPLPHASVRRQSKPEETESARYLSTSKREQTWEEEQTAYAGLCTISVNRGTVHLELPNSIRFPELRDSKCTLAGSTFQEDPRVVVGRVSSLVCDELRDANYSAPPSLLFKEFILKALHDALQPVARPLEPTRLRLVVYGPPKSGVSTTLRTMSCEAVSLASFSTGGSAAHASKASQLLRGCLIIPLNWERLVRSGSTCENSSNCNSGIDSERIAEDESRYHTRSVADLYAAFMDHLWLCIACHCPDLTPELRSGRYASQSGENPEGRGFNDDTAGDMNCIRNSATQLSASWKRLLRHDDIDRNIYRSGILSTEGRRQHAALSDRDGNTTVRESASNTGASVNSCPPLETPPLSFYYTALPLPAVPLFSPWDASRVGPRALQQWEAFSRKLVPLLAAAAAFPEDGALRRCIIEVVFVRLVQTVAASLGFHGVCYVLESPHVRLEDASPRESVRGLEPPRIRTDRTSRDASFAQFMDSVQASDLHVILGTSTDLSAAHFPNATSGARGKEIAPSANSNAVRSTQSGGTLFSMVSTTCIVPLAALTSTHASSSRFPASILVGDDGVFPLEIFTGAPGYLAMLHRLLQSATRTASHNQRAVLPAPGGPRKILEEEYDNRDVDKRLSVDELRIGAASEATKMRVHRALYALATRTQHNTTTGSNHLN